MLCSIQTLKIRCFPMLWMRLTTGNKRPTPSPSNGDGDGDGDEDGTSSYAALSLYFRYDTLLSLHANKMEITAMEEAAAILRDDLAAQKARARVLENQASRASAKEIPLSLSTKFKLEKAARYNPHHRHRHRHHHHHPMTYVERNWLKYLKECLLEPS